MNSRYRKLTNTIKYEQKVETPGYDKIMRHTKWFMELYTSDSEKRLNFGQKPSRPKSVGSSSKYLNKSRLSCLRSFYNKMFMSTVFSLAYL